MKALRFWTGMIFANLASVAIAGIPIDETVICPIGGKSFTITGTGACTTFGGTQDFLLKVQTSCDFVTRLPKCPENGFPVYKAFTPTEIALLNDYAKGDEFAAMATRSRFYIAKKVDDFLISKGSAPTFNFWCLLGGLQQDREATINDVEYLGWVKSVGRADLSKASKDDAPIIQLVLAYVAYLTGDFDAATSDLRSVKLDTSVKENAFIQRHVTRLSACVAARNVKLCPASERVMLPVR
jgi:hypothetical protein